MTATSGDTRGGVGYDLTEVFRGNRTALVGGVGIVVERHEAVLRYNGLSSCQTFFATEFCLLWHLDFSLTTLESCLLVQCLQQFCIRLEVYALEMSGDLAIFLYPFRRTKLACIDFT